MFSAFGKPPEAIIFKISPALPTNSDIYCTRGDTLSPGHLKEFDIFSLIRYSDLLLPTFIADINNRKIR